MAAVCGSGPRAPRLIIAPLLATVLLFGADRAQHVPTTQPARAQPPRFEEGLSLVDQVGGATLAARWNGEHVVVGMGPRLLVVATPAGRPPHVVGRSSILPGLVDDIAADDKRALVGIRDGGVWLVDLRDPRAPTVVAELVAAASAAPPARGWRTPGTMALLDEGSLGVVVGTGDLGSPNHGLVRLFDLEDPSAPRALAPLRVKDEVIGIAADREQLYLAVLEEHPAHNRRSIQRYEVPESGEGLRLTATSGLIQDLIGLLGARGDQVAYHVSRRAVVADFGTGDVLYEAEYSFFPDGMFGSFDGERLVFAEDDNLFRLGGREVQIHRRVNGQWSRGDDIVLPPVGQALGLDLVDGRLFIAGGAAGLLAWDVGAAGSVGVLRLDFGLGTVLDVDQAGCCAVTASSTGVAVVDVSREGASRIVSAQEADGPSTAIGVAGNAIVVAAHDNPAYHEPGVLNAPASTIHVFDIDPSGRITRESALRLPGASRPRQLTVDHRRAVIAMDGGVLLHVAPEHPPRELRRQPLGVAPRGIDAHDDRLLVTFLDRGLGTAGLWRLDSSDLRPLSDREGRYEGPVTSTPAGALSGHLAVFGDGRTLNTVDVEEGHTPMALGGIDLPASPPAATARMVPGVPGLSQVDMGLHLDNGIAWAAHGPDGVFGIDVRVPHIPELIAATKTPGRVRRAISIGDRVFVAAGQAGLLVLRWDDHIAKDRLWLPWAGAGAIR